MRNIFFLLFLLSTEIIFSQQIIIVKDAQTGLALENVEINCNGKSIGKTDRNGILDFKTKCQTFNIELKGYYDEDIMVEKEMKVKLSKIEKGTKGIQTIVLQDKSDPKAIEILKKAYRYYNENSPSSLPSYEYKSYEKIAFDLDQDSITSYNQFVEKRIDSLKKIQTFNQTKKKEKDSLEDIKFMQLMGESKLFLWERVSAYINAKKYGEKVNILDNKISGFQQPFYEMMTLRSNRNKIPRQLQEENRSRYRYFLTDSLNIDGRKTYVIKFRQIEDKKAVSRRKFNGSLYIDAETYGLRKLSATSRKSNEGSIVSNWKLVEGKWFLEDENIKFKIGNTVFKDKNKKTPNDEKQVQKKFGNYVYMHSTFFDFKSPIDVKRKDFSGYSLAVENADGSLLQKYRKDSLTEREQQTYVKIDSIGKKYHLDRTATFLSSALRGRLRLGIFTLDLGSIVKIDKYETLRLGASIKLNEEFSRYLSPDLYFAYGFKDQAWKYGLGLDLRTTLKKNSLFRAEYTDNIGAAGRFNEQKWNFIMKMMNAGVDLNNLNFYHYKTFKLSFENDLTNGITLKLTAKKSNEKALFDYNYNGIGNHFNAFSTMLSLKFSPNSKNIMTPSGKFTFDTQFPELYINYEQGLKAFGGELSFSRIDALFLQKIKSRIGVTRLRLFGGILLNDAPIWYHFMMNGLSSPKQNINFNLTTYLGFATMEAGKYYNDKFVDLYLTHRIPWYFRTIGSTISSIDVVYNGSIGNMTTPELHQFKFKKLDRLYNEIGVEWNNFMSSPFNLGFFYRVGYYNSPKFIDNFAIQLKLKILGF